MPDLLFNNLDDCTAITVSTPNPDLIGYMSGTTIRDYTDVQAYTVTWSNNCCTDIVVNVPPRYDFDFEYLGCTSTVILGVTFTNYEMQLININGNFISSITAQATNLPNSTPGNIQFTINPDNSTQFTLIALASVSPINYDLVVTTNMGFIYTIKLVLIQDTNNPCGTWSFGAGSPYITYPELDETIEYINDNELVFTTLTGNNPVLSGVYQVAICEVREDDVAECVQNHVFVDCGDLKCWVVRKFAECTDTDVLNYYEALTFVNDCTDNITYDEVCAIYEVLNIKLETDGCYAQEDDCNCSGARTKSNKMLLPTKKHTTTKGCGCSS